MSVGQRRALVTGGAAGIGAAIVRKLVADGFAVVFCDRDQVAGTALAQASGAVFVLCDATDFTAVENLFAAHAPFDVLVNSVGADQHAFMTDTTPQEWRDLLAINLETAFLFTQKALPAMQKARYGRIVMITSEAGRLGSKGGAVYAAAKAGLIGFTRSIARENARYGITVNAVAPGPVWTVLFGTIAFSGWLIWVGAGYLTSSQPALIAYFSQIVLNTLWSPIFFGLKRPGLAALEMALNDGRHPLTRWALGPRIASRSSARVSAT